MQAFSIGAVSFSRDIWNLWAWEFGCVKDRTANVSYCMETCKLLCRMPWTFLHKELFQPKWHWCYLLRNMVLECKGRKIYRTLSFPLRHFPASEEVRSINNAGWVMIRAKLDYVDNFSITGNRRIVGRWRFFGPWRMDGVEAQGIAWWETWYMGKWG